MIAHSNEFKQELNTFGREFKNKIGVYENLLLATENDKTILTEDGLEIIAKVSNDNISYEIEDERLYNIKLIRKGELLSTLMKELDFESDLNLDVGNVIDYQFGIKVNNSYEYLDFGKFIIYKKEYKNDTKTYSYVSYDFMLKTMVSIGTEFTFLTTPTGADMLPKICTILGINFDNSLVEQDNITPTPYGMIKNLTYNININPIKEAKITYRDLLNLLCQYFGVSMYMENNDLKIKLLGKIEYDNGWIVNNEQPIICDTLTEEIFKDKNVTFKDKYGKINALNMSGTDETKTIYVEDTQSVSTNGLTLFEVKNNLILNDTTIWNDYATNIANNILELINNVSFNLCDFSTYGILYLEWLDYFNVVINDITYNCLLLNSEVTIKGGIGEEIYTDFPEKNVSEYTTSPKSNDIIGDTIRARGNAYANGFKLLQENEINSIIFDSGSNANGSYIKFADGTMICYKTVSGTADISTAWGSLYTSSSIDLGSWPVSFISRPVTIVNTQNSSGTQFMLAGQSGSGASTANLCGTTTMIRPNSRTGVSYILDIIGIGKWK